MHPKNINSVILFLSVIMLVSCTSKTYNANSNPREIYLAYIEKSQKVQEYGIEDNLDIIGYKGLDLKMRVFKKNKNEKTLLEMNAGPQTANFSEFKINGMDVMCLIENNEFLGCSSNNNNETNALNELGQLKYLKEFQDLASQPSFYSTATSKESDINFSGEDEIIGRKCDKFNIKMSSISKFAVIKLIKHMHLEDSKLNDFRAEMKTCLDQKTGIPLYIKIFYKTKSEPDNNDLGGELISIMATSFTENVDDKSFAIPVRFLVIDSACDNNNFVIAIEPFRDYNGQISINLLTNKRNLPDTIDTINSVSVSLKEGNLKLIEAQSNYLPKYNSKFEVCLEGDCQSGLYLQRMFLNCKNQKEKINCLRKSADEIACESDTNCEFHDSICAARPGIFIPNRCLFQAGIACEDYKATPGQIDLYLTNVLGYNISSISVNAENCGSTDAPFLYNGRTSQFTIKCNPKLSGDRYEGKISVTYTADFTSLSHVNSGKLVTKIE